MGPGGAQGRAVGGGALPMIVWIVLLIVFAIGIAVGVAWAAVTLEK